MTDWTHEWQWFLKRPDICLQYKFSGFTSGDNSSRAQTKHAYRLKSHYSENICYPGFPTILNSLGSRLCNIRVSLGLGNWLKNNQNRHIETLINLILLMSINRGVHCCHNSKGCVSFFYELCLLFFNTQINNNKVHVNDSII